jgi:hypothetical protein
LRGYHNDAFEVSEEVYQQELGDFLRGIAK